jgi:hypothetical protein
MKESEFYHTAFENSAFRREKLEELRYFKKVGAGLLVFVSVCFVAHAVYAGLKDGSWDGAMGWLAALMMVGGAFSVCSTRVAALEAIEERAEVLGATVRHASC